MELFIISNRNERICLKKLLTLWLTLKGVFGKKLKFWKTGKNVSRGERTKQTRPLDQACVVFAQWPKDLDLCLGQSGDFFAYHDPDAAVDPYELPSLSQFRYIPQRFRGQIPNRNVLFLQQKYTQQRPDRVQLVQRTLGAV